MRVIHVAPTPFGEDGLLGGGERYPLELARALVAHVDVELVTFGKTAREFTDASGLRVRVLPARFHRHGHPAHPFAPGLGRSLDGADIVHTHHTRSWPSRMAAVVAAAARRPVVTTDHGLGGGGWAGLLPALFARHLAVSQYSARVLGLSPSRVRVVYGGADTSRFRPSSADRSGALFVGRVTPHKGLDVALRALPPAARMTVVGTGGHDPQPPERDYGDLVRRLADGRDVEFTGPVTDDVLVGLYQRARVLVLPSVHTTCYGRRIAISELLGLAAVEAMACGTPVVASAVGGLVEVVRHGETGFLVTPGDVADLRLRMEQLLGDDALVSRMGEAARRRVLESLSWDACARRCADAYAEVIGPR